MISNKKIIEETIEKVYLQQFNINLNDYFKLINLSVMNINYKITEFITVMRNTQIEFSTTDKTNLSNFSNEYVYLFSDYCYYSMGLRKNFETIINVNTNHINNIYSAFINEVKASNELQNIINIDDNYILSIIEEKYINHRIHDITEFYYRLIESFKEELIMFARFININVFKYNMSKYYKINHPYIIDFL
jgi:hypothetical protein